ncbi:unnamed protein product [Brassica oleracea]|uniref:(rape) hypothetical protein n=1 Tax=Brassica napus TaxID=3708 RepID=A0A816KMD6_BRANA|nr:unnamed protein product [Brassica napus]
MKSLFFLVFIDYHRISFPINVLVFFFCMGFFSQSFFQSLTLEKIVLLFCLIKKCFRFETEL